MGYHSNMHPVLSTLQLNPEQLKSSTTDPVWVYDDDVRYAALSKGGEEHISRDIWRERPGLQTKRSPFGISGSL